MSKTTHKQFTKRKPGRIRRDERRAAIAVKQAYLLG